MSELTRCNHCVWLDIVRRYHGVQIELREESDLDGDLHWIAAYVDDVRVASFLELTEECVC